MRSVGIVVALVVAVLWSANAGADPTPTYSQRLVGTATEAGADRPLRLKLRFKVQVVGPDDPIAGWGHWGSGASSVEGALTSGASPAFTIWLADDRARLCTLSGTPELPTGASFGVGTVAGTYTCINYTGTPTGGGTFALKRPPRPPSPMGVPGY